MTTVDNGSRFVGRRPKYTREVLSNIVEGVNQKKSSSLYSYLKTKNMESKYGPIYSAMKRKGLIKASERKARRPTIYTDEFLKGILNNIQGNSNKPVSLKDYLRSINRDKEYGGIYQALKREGMITQINMIRRPRKPVMAQKPIAQGKFKSKKAAEKAK